MYAHYLVSHQPQRSTDLFAYFYVVATCHAEESFHLCMAYDVAFRKKVARFHLTAQGQIDPQLYTMVFTRSGKARPRAWCEYCLTSSHSSNYPRLSSGGPAKKPRVTPAGPRQSSQSQANEICRNYNRGRCLHQDCLRRHMCLTPGCHTPHPAQQMLLF